MLPKNVWLSDCPPPANLWTTIHPQGVGLLCSCCLSMQVHACSWCMFVLHVLAACPRFVFMLYVHAAWRAELSMLHVHASCPCFMLMKHAYAFHAASPCCIVHAAYRCWMSLLYAPACTVQAACTRCIPTLHVHAAYPSCTSMLQAHAACLRCISMLHVMLMSMPHVPSACPCFMSILHAHVALAECTWCTSLLHALVACRYCIYILHIHDAYPRLCCICMLRARASCTVHAACSCHSPCFMPFRREHAAFQCCPCYMSMLHIRVHAACSFCISILGFTFIH